MDDKQLLQLFFARSDASQVLWTLYVTVIFGLLAFLAAAEKASRAWQVRLVLAISFLGFAISSLYTLLRLSRQRMALAEAILSDRDASAPPWLEEAVDAGLPALDSVLVSTHVAVSLTVLALIWFFPKLRSERASILATGK